MIGSREPYKPSSASGIWMWTLVAILAISALFLLLPVYRNYRSRQEELARLKVERAQLQEIQLRKESQVNRLEKSPEEVEKVAREKYNLVKEGESVMVYPTARGDKKSR